SGGEGRIVLALQNHQGQRARHGINSFAIQTKHGDPTPAAACGPRRYFFGYRLVCLVGERKLTFSRRAAILKDGVGTPKKKKKHYPHAAIWSTETAEEVDKSRFRHLVLE